MIEPSIKRKVFAYITSEQRLLLLLHPDHPEAGIQVPAGTIRPGETVEEAVMREATEETGLVNLELVSTLGSRTFDMRPFGRNELHERHFVHLRCHDETSAAFDHWESDPEGSPGERIRFRLVWSSLGEPLPDFIAGHDAFVDVLRASAARRNQTPG